MAHTDPEIELYRNLIEQPDEYIDGFGTKAILGSLFVGFVMMPGAIYLGLMAGQTLGPAAEWTTIILFTEIARRSYVSMSRAEVYILYYIAASLASMQGGLALAGGAFAGSMWLQYFVRSPAAKGMGVTGVPTWAVPPADSPALAQRTFLHPDWLVPILLTVGGRLLGRMVWFGMGYTMFRVTSDYENLPFPFAAITAQGATALAEASSKEETWRWRTFSIGAMIGLVFGVIYLGIPTITGVIMTEPVQLIPIPWVDLTRTTESILPAVPMGFMTNLGEIINGFVVPFWAVVGSLIAALGMAIVNPQLYKVGILHTWRPGMDTINTQFYNQIDFYFSVGIGASLAIVAVMGFYEIYRKMRYDRQARERGEATHGGWVVPSGRGDLPLWIPVGAYAVAALAYIALCAVLVPEFPVFIIAGFAFLISPFESYINARMIGMTGQFLGVPMILEATIIFSGYRGIDIWFAPIPRFNVGGAAQEFRVLELTGDKIISLVKAELIMLPISIFCSLLFWQFIWRLAPVPSSYYPYAQKMWPLSALQQGLWLTSTVNPETSIFYKAWNQTYAMGGFVAALGLYAGLSALRLPLLLIYGVVRGFGILPHSVIPQMIGALISQFYFIPRFGAHRWKLYATVLAAGFACGMGLIGMGTIALALIGKAVSQMPF